MRFIYEREGKRFEYHIPEGNMIVGRDRKADIAIFDNSISRHHITVVRRDRMVQIRDLGSRNGSYVNNKRVTEAKLEPGDVVRLGNLSLFFDDGSPGLEIPNDLEGFLGDHDGDDDTNPTPVDGTATPPAATPPLPYDPNRPPPLPHGFQPPPGVDLIQRGNRWFLREPTTGREVEYVPQGAAPEPTREADVISARTLTNLAARAREFYLEHKKPVLYAFAGISFLLLAAAVVRVAFTPPPEPKRVMPPQVYDDFLGQGLDAFGKWTGLKDSPPASMSQRTLEKERKTSFRNALKYFETADKNLPQRETARIMINVMEAWEALPDDLSRRDWSNVRGYLDELESHENVTPKAREFARGVIRGLNHEINSWAQARFAQKLFEEWRTGGDIETLKAALVEFRKLDREFAGTPAQESHDGMVAGIIEKFREYYEAEGDQRFSSGDWNKAIESFEKAKEYADETRRKALDERIDSARFLIEQDAILPRARELKARGDLDGLVSLLSGVPDSSPVYKEARRMMRDARYELQMGKARDYYRQGDAASAIRNLEDPEFYTDADVCALREKVRKVAKALEAGDAALESAMAGIEEMEEPREVTQFEDARRLWNEVKNLETQDPSNAFVVQAQRRIYDLTNEKIGGLYFAKAEKLFDSGDLRKGRDFLDLARKYDLRLGLERLREWKTEAGKRYNRAINLVGSDKDEARRLLQWIVDVLRPGDSEYFDKARAELSKLGN